MQLNRTLQPAIAALTVSTRSWPTLALMIGADVIGLGASSLISIYTRLVLEGKFHPSLYWQLWPVLILFILTYAVVGLYPGVAISPVDELRWVSLSTTLVYLILGSAIFLRREGEIYSRGIFLTGLGLSILLVLLSRWLVRHVFAPQTWWGYPAMVLGAGKTGAMVIRTLKRRPGIGLKPVVVLDDDPDKWGMLDGVPVVGSLELAPLIAQRRRVPYGIVAMPGVPRDRLLKLLENYAHSFAHLLIIPDLFGFSSLWVEAKDLGGILGLEVRQRLLMPGPRLMKLLIDLAFTLIGGLFLLPIIAVIVVLIWVDSRGPIFYGQSRIGLNGQPFKAWKFRSMVHNADQVLNAYLAEHPELKDDWETGHKLRNDSYHPYRSVFAADEPR